MRRELLGIFVIATIVGSAQSPAAPKAAKPVINRAPQAVIDQHIDRAWVKNNLLDLLGHWRDASVMPSGFIQENLDREWKPWGTQRDATVNGQGRQLYTMVAGYEYSHDKKYLEDVYKRQHNIGRRVRRDGGATLCARH